VRWSDAQKARDAAAVPVLTRLARDLERATSQARLFLEYLEPRLFDPEFNKLTEAYVALDLDPDQLRHEIKALTGMAPKTYVRAQRLTVAKKLLTTTPMDLETMSALVGYSSSKTLADAFRRHLSISPAHYRKHQRANEKRFSPNLVEKLREERLDAKEAHELAAYLRAHYPEEIESDGIRFGASEEHASPARVVSLRELERLNAERLWEEIKDLPFDVQQQRIRQATHFTTPALFEVLKAAGSRAGREDSDTSIQIAKLALTAAFAFEPPNPDTGTSTLWAQAWIYLANRRRIAFQLEQAEIAFDQAEHFLPLDAESVLRGEFAFNRAALRWYQQSYQEGLELVDQAVTILEPTKAHTSLAKALLVRSIILGYAGRIEQGIESLNRVLDLLPKIGNPIHLGVTTHYTLARYHRDMGDYGNARKVLDQLRDWSQRYQLRVYEMFITWFEGRIALDLHDPTQAERLLVAAQTGFACGGFNDHARLVGLDLAIAYATQEKKDKSLETIQDSIPVLELWREDHPHIERAWRTLKKTILARSARIDDLVRIRDVLDSFREDPASSRYFDFAAIAV